jgi:hypothetical protein
MMILKCFIALMFAETSFGFQIVPPTKRTNHIQNHRNFIVIPNVNSHQILTPPYFHSKLKMSGRDEDIMTFSTPLDKPILATIDFAALVTFAGVGKASHSADGASDIQAVLTTALPFLLAWYATSPFTGVYRDGDGGVINAGKIAAKGWIVAVPLGCALRGVIKGYLPPAPFVIVTLIATLVMVGGSRMLYSVAEDKLNGKQGEV